MKQLGLLSLATAFLLSSSIASAQDRTWAGGNGDWGTASNWGGDVPDTFNETAAINSSNSTVNVDSSFNVGALSFGFNFNAVLNVQTGNTLQLGTGLRDGRNLTMRNGSTITGAGNLVAGGTSPSNDANLRAWLMGGAHTGSGTTTFNSGVTIRAPNGMSADTTTIQRRLETAAGSTSEWQTQTGGGGPFEAGVNIDAGGNFVNGGVFNKIQNTNTGTFGNLNLNNGGMFTNAAGGVLNVSGSGTFDVETVNNGTFVNAGTINVNGTTMDLNDAGLTFDNQAGGSVNLSNGGVFNSGGDLTITMGTLAGNGTVNDNVVVTNGNINPGASPGQLDIVGDLTIDGSTLTIEINGTTAGMNPGFDLLTVTGAVTLTNTPNIAIQLTDGFMPANNTDFVFFTAGSGLDTGAVTFDFSGAGGAGAWTTNRTATSMTATFVPEPSSLALLGLGTFGIAFRRRRTS